MKIWEEDVLDWKAQGAHPLEKADVGGRASECGPSEQDELLEDVHVRDLKAQIGGGRDGDNFDVSEKTG